MRLLVFLHFYQPHNQQDDILMRIVNECYLPLTRGLLQNPRAKIVVNISGVLTNLLISKGYGEVIDNLRTLAARGQVELTGSSMYHAFLPLLPREEVLRQIEMNEAVNKKEFGEAFKPTGFFSPEMAADNTLFDIVKERGYSWVPVSELSLHGEMPSYEKFYKLANGLDVIFREKRVSSLMLSGVCKTSEDFINQTKDLHETCDYWVTVMDAETFGHHRIGHEKFLFDVLNNEFFVPVTATELLAAKNGLETEYVKLRPSTWTNEEQDYWLDKERTKETIANSFILWKDPQNPIHKLQWQLADYVTQLVNSYSDKQSDKYLQARDLLDSALASDQFWWASAKPWWSLEMIEQGAFQLKQVLVVLEPGESAILQAEELYRKILDQAFDWQRSGYIRKRHLNHSGTFMARPFKNRTHAEWYNQVILEFEDEMNKAAANKEFEKAIKWRDAVLKLSQGTDMFDVLHVVNELWTVRTIPSLKPFFEHSWEEFSNFAKEHMLEIPSKEAFEKWKTTRKRVEPAPDL